MRELPLLTKGVGGWGANTSLQTTISVFKSGSIRKKKLLVLAYHVS